MGETIANRGTAPWPLNAFTGNKPKLKVQETPQAPSSAEHCFYCWAFSFLCRSFVMLLGTFRSGSSPSSCTGLVSEFGGFLSGRTRGSLCTVLGRPCWRRKPEHRTVAAEETSAGSQMQREGRPGTCLAIY